jgi:hypothetical protein
MKITNKLSLPQAIVDAVSNDDPGDECLLWTGCKTAAGYGTFGHDGKSHYVHRAVEATPLS